MPKVATLFLTGIIMPEAWNWFDEPIISLGSIQAKIAAAGEYEELMLDIDTDGGVIEEGWRCYDYLKGLGVNIKTRCGGVVASMGISLFLLGTERTLSPHAKLIAHQPSGGLEGNINDFKEYLQGLEIEQARLLDLYVSVTGKPDTEIASLLADGKDHVFNTDEAIAYGWATGVYASTATPATAKRTRQPIMAHLSEGRKGLHLPEHKSPIIDMTKISNRLDAAWKAIKAQLDGKPLVNLSVDTADGKKLDIETTGDSYVVGDPVKYDDGTDVADGDYILSDGNTITVMGGAISAITEPTDDEAEPATAEPTAQADSESVTISKSEHDRLLALDSQVTALRAKSEEHDKFQARVTKVLATMESADPIVARLPETPIERRTPSEESPADRKAARKAALATKA